MAYVYKIIKFIGYGADAEYIQSDKLYSKEEFEKLCRTCEQDILRGGFSIDQYLIKKYEFEHVKAVQCYSYDCGGYR